MGVRHDTTFGRATLAGRRPHGPGARGAGGRAASDPRGAEGKGCRATTGG
jgi:hypothetical protein